MFKREQLKNQKEPRNLVFDTKNQWKMMDLRPQIYGQKTRNNMKVVGSNGSWWLEHPCWKPMVCI